MDGATPRWAGTNRFLVLQPSRCLSRTPCAPGLQDQVVFVCRAGWLKPNQQAPPARLHPGHSCLACQSVATYYLGGPALGHCRGAHHQEAGSHQKDNQGRDRPFQPCSTRWELGPQQ